MASLCDQIRGPAKLVSLGELMADRITQFSRRKSASSNNQDGHVSKWIPISLLDTHKIRTYKLGIVMQGARVALALVVSFSIAYVLITPDPTDDVYGVLQPNHPTAEQKVLAVSLWEFPISLTVLLQLLSLPAEFTRHSSAFELLDVISVWRC
jgi:hypothetical protein